MRKFKIKGNSCTFEYRKINPVTKKTNYKSKTIKYDETLSESKRNKYLEAEYLKFEEEMDEFFKLGKDLNDYTLKEYNMIYLNQLRSNFSLSNYKRNEEVSEFVVSKLGHIKLRDLTPMIIQEFYNEVNKLQKITVKVKVNNNFESILKAKNITYSTIRYELKIQHSTYTTLLKGGKCSEEWALKFCQKTNIRFDDIFIKEVNITDFAYNTKVKYTNFLRAMLQDAKRKQIIDENFASSDFITKFKNPEPNKKTDCLNKEEFKKLFIFLRNYTDIRIKTALSIIINTGIRKEELLGLKWSSLDIDKKTITIKSTVLYIRGEGLIENDNSTKNKSSNRILNISDEMISLLKEYKETFYGDNNDYIFSSNNKKPINPNTINYWLDKVLDENNLRHVTVHSLRHSYLSLLMENEPVAIVSKRAGHSRISTTTDIYGHVMSKNDKKVAETSLYLEDRNIKSQECHNALKILYDNKLLSKDLYEEILKKINAL